MREVIIRLNGQACRAQLCLGSQVIEETLIELNGPTNWYDLLAKVGEELKLANHPPPGLFTEGDLHEDKLIATVEVKNNVTAEGVRSLLHGATILLTLGPLPRLSDQMSKMLHQDEDTKKL